LRRLLIASRIGRIGLRLGLRLGLARLWPVLPSRLLRRVPLEASLRKLRCSGRPWCLGLRCLWLRRLWLRGLRLRRLRPRRLRLRRLRLRRARLRLRCRLLLAIGPDRGLRHGRRLRRLAGITITTGLRLHDGNIRHGFWPQFHDARFELRIDAPEQRSGIEIEERAVGIDHAAGLGPGRQGINCPLFKRFDHLNWGGNPRGEVCFGEVTGDPEVPKQLGHFRIIAGWHFLDPVKINTLPPGKQRRVD